MTLIYIHKKYRHESSEDQLHEIKRSRNFKRKKELLYFNQIGGPIQETLGSRQEYSLDRSPSDTIAAFD